jgi:hypothetical protein
MTDNTLTDIMSIILITGATRANKICVPFPVIQRMQDKGHPRRTAAEIDAAAEALLRRKYVERLPCARPAEIWKDMPRLGPVTLKVTPRGEAAINW